MPKIDRRWRDMRPGDQFFSKRPLHELERAAEQLAREGRMFSFSPAPGGYLATLDSVDEKQEGEE